MRGLVALGATSACLVLAWPAHAVIPSGNLIVNPGADNAAGATTDTTSPSVPGWTLFGPLTARQYAGCTTICPAAADRPTDAGANMFTGGPGNSITSAQQIIDVSADAAAIDSDGGVVATLSGWLGGFGAQPDRMYVDMQFADASNLLILFGNYSKQIGPVTAADRGNQTKLLFRSYSHQVPPGTRKIYVGLRTQGVNEAGGESSYNNGYADSLSLTLTAASTAITSTAAPGDLAAAFSTVPVTGSSWHTGPPGTTVRPHGVVTGPFAGLPTHGSTFALMTNGRATYADDQTFDTAGGHVHNNSTPTPGRGDTARDGSTLRVDLDVPAGTTCLTFQFRFLSEEFPEFVGGQFNDAFIAELDRTTWTTSGSAITAPDNFAFDESGKVISINSLGVAGFSAANAAGTAYDGATILLRASTPVTPGAHSLYLSIFDQGDGVADSAVMIDQLEALALPNGCAKGATSAAAPPPPPAAGGGGSDPPPTSGAPPADASSGAPATSTGPPTTTPSSTATPASPKLTAAEQQSAVFGANGYVNAPSPKACASRRNFRIRIRQPKGKAKILQAFVFVNGKKVATRAGKRLTAPVDLRGLPKGRFTVRITIVLADGETVAGIRRYRTCAKRRAASKRRPRV